MSEIDIILNAGKIRDKLIEDVTKQVENENEQDKYIRETKKKIYDNWRSSGMEWEVFIKTLSDIEKKLIGIKDNTNSSNKKSFKMPTWGLVAIGVGSAAVIALVITLGIKASKKAKVA